MGGEAGELWGHYTEKGLVWASLVLPCRNQWASGTWLMRRVLLTVTLGQQRGMRFVSGQPGRKGLLVCLQLFLGV